MNRTRALVLSLAIGAAAVAMVFALGRTLTLGQQARAAGSSDVARRTAQLDRYEASLRRALDRNPPALPPVPAASAAPPAAAQPRVIYQRPPTVVITRQRAGDEERELEGAEADD